MVNLALDFSVYLESCYARICYFILFGNHLAHSK